MFRSYVVPGLKFSQSLMLMLFDKIAQKKYAVNILPHSAVNESD